MATRTKQDPEVTEAEATEAESNGAPRADRPSYGIAKVGGELPEQPKVQRGRSNVYFDLLVQVTSDPGEWYEIATFKTQGGARLAVKALKEGERQIPDGDWEFDSRRVQGPEGEKWSKLYARFLG